MKDCLFCRIINREIPAKIVYEDERILAIDDIEPAAPVHVLIIPKKHIPSVEEIAAEDRELIGDLFIAAPKIAQDKGVALTGYRIAVNRGADAGQTINHLHFHLLGGKKLSLA